MTRMLLAAPWTALLVAGLLPWLGTTTTPADKPNKATVQQSELPSNYVAPTDEEMADRKRRRDQFVDYHEKVTQELIEEAITFRQYVDLLFNYCLARYPEYLEHVDNTEPGQSLRAKIAHNAGNLAAAAGSCSHLPNFAAFSERIRLSLREFLCEEETSQQSLPAANTNLQ